MTTSTIEPGHFTSGDDPEALKLRIRNLVRDTRRSRHITQAKLGQLINASRFVINRIERGASEVSPDLAELLADALDLPELVTLVAQREEPALIDNTRDAVIKRMLGTPGLVRVRMVLADDFNLYRHLHDRVADDAKLRCDDIEIVVPTIARSRALFGGGSAIYGRIEYQLKRLLDLMKSAFYATNSLRLYESDEVIAAMLVTTTSIGTEGAVWPPMPVRHEPNEFATAKLPVGVTTDPKAIAQLNSHLDALIGEHETVKSNEALCLVDADDASTPTAFTRYFTVGEDVEEDVDPGEGTAVALIMVIALCPRKRYGIGRRVITYRRTASRKYQRRSLFSNTVEEIDIRRARAEEHGQQIDDYRSTRGALAAALDTNEYLTKHNGIIPNTAFQLSAAREMAMFDLDIDPDRFEPIPLPEKLRLIDKQHAAIAPRLFVLQLRNDQAQPELARLQEVADVDEFGTEDLMTNDNLNDFLKDARQTGFLGELLTSYQIAQR